MKWSFQPTTPEHFAAISGIQREAMGMADGHPMLRERMAQWKYWSKHPFWDGPLSYGLFEGEEMVAHCSLVPLRLKHAGGVLTACHTTDWSAKTGSVGAGAAIMKQMSKLVDAVMIVGGSEFTLKMVAPLGFKQYGEVEIFARPLRPLRRIGKESGLRGLARVGRAFAWGATASSVDVSGWTCSPLEAREIAEAAPPGAVAHYEHPSALIGYLAACPEAPGKAFAVNGPQGQSGYFLLNFVPGQARLSVHSLDSARPEDWRALFELARRAALDNSDTLELAVMTNASSVRDAAVASGFHQRGSVPMNLLFRDKLKALDAAPAFSMADSDAAFLHDGSAQLLA